jgi:hypothetical protein
MTKDVQLLVGLVGIGALMYFSYNYIKKNPQSKLALGTGGDTKESFSGCGGCSQK